MCKQYSERSSGLKKAGQEIKETFSVETNYGIVVRVPITGWKELVPYWKAICRAIFEVLIENDFHPCTATLKRPEGFVASSNYWRRSLKNPTRVPLSEARFFIYKLKEKPYFIDSIKRFNEKSKKNWLEENNIAVLGGYLCSFYLTLKPALKVVKKGTKNYLKPKLASRKRPNTKGIV